MASSRASLIVWAWSQRRWRWQTTPLDFAIAVWIVAFALSLLTNLDSWRRIALGLWFMGVYIGVWYLLATLWRTGRCAARG